LCLYDTVPYPANAYGHGWIDFRIPDSQGIGAFTALQRRGIPSRLLYFAEENHWVLKPQNSLRWHTEVFRWFDEFVGEESVSSPGMVIQA
jgi:dipeptidyl aminopeptidase/acylaminoacyl peptidase